MKRRFSCVHSCVLVCRGAFGAYTRTYIHSPALRSLLPIVINTTTTILQVRMRPPHTISHHQLCWWGMVLVCWLLVSNAEAQRTWLQQQPPPTSFFTPDVDVTSTTPLPRVPPSPYGNPPSRLCPSADGVPYAVGGFPGTPYIITPFSSIYTSPPPAQPTTTVCRTGDPNPKHCMTAYHIEINTLRVRPFDATIAGCRAQPPTTLLAYNGTFPGPLITAPV